MTEPTCPRTGRSRSSSRRRRPSSSSEVAREPRTQARTEHLLIVLDIDGTVLLEDETLSPGVVEAVEDAHRAGHEVMIATGRSWEGTRGILAGAGDRGRSSWCAPTARSSCGASRRRVRYERFHTETFDPTEVLTLLREHLPDAKYMVELADGAPALHRVPRGLEPLRRATACPSTSSPASRCAAWSSSRPGTTSRTSSTSSTRIGLNQVSYAVGWTAWLDIAPQGVDKGTALELRARVARHRSGARAGDRRRPQRRRHVPLGARERRARRRDGAGSARGPGCRGRDDHVGAGGRRGRGAPQPLLRSLRRARSGPPQALLEEWAVPSARLDACSTDAAHPSAGRVVRAADGPGLENQWAAMSRGFESHTLRFIVGVLSSPAPQASERTRVSDSTKPARRGRRTVARHGELKSPHPFGQLVKIFGDHASPWCWSRRRRRRLRAYDLTASFTEDAVDLEGQEAPPPDIGAIEGGVNLFVAGTDACEPRTRATSAIGAPARTPRASSTTSTCSSTSPTARAG